MAGTNGGAVDINVGGVVYSTTVATLTKKPDSRLGRMFRGVEDATGAGAGVKLTHGGKVFIDRDGVLFRYVLDYLRSEKLVLPENFQERERLKQEAEFYQLTDLVQFIDVLTHPQRQTSLRSPRSPLSPASLNSNGNTQGLPSAMGVGGQEPGYITIGYRGTFAFGRDGAMADVKFRKLLRILVAGRVSLCKEVFGETLNESRDPDRGDTDRYTSRFFLKHPFLEQAFDMLLDAGFRMVGSCGAGTNGAGDVKPGMDSEECKWLHYNEFVFCRP